MATLEPLAPIPTPAPKPDTTLAVLSYALNLLTWIASLVILLVAKKEDKFTRFHAAQALGIALIHFLVSIPLFLVWFAAFWGDAYGMFSADPAQFQGPDPVGWLGPMLLVMAASCGVWIVVLVLYILGAVKASRAEYWRMPLIGNIAARIAGLPQ